MDREDIKKIRQELDTILSAYGAKKGLQFQLGNISYSSNQFNCKMTATSGDSKEDADKVNWDKNCWSVGLSREDFGKTINYIGNNYKLVGIKPRSRNYPVVVEQIPSGRRFKFTASMVKRGLQDIPRS